jgi:cell division septation protein DedD
MKTIIKNPSALCVARRLLVLFLFIICVAVVYAEGAKAVIDSILNNESGTAGSVSRVVDGLSKAASEAETQSDKRSLLIFLASVQEHAGRYSDASRSYATAAGIAASPAQGMPRVTAEQLVIDAVRCALSAGDYVTAETYLSSTVRSSTDPVIQAHIGLYTAWCLLSKAQTQSDLAGAVALLDVFSANPLMESVRPEVLLTLWYLDKTDARRIPLVNAYPDSPEAAVAQGQISLLPSPFWYFLPSKIENAPQSGQPAVTQTVPASAIPLPPPVTPAQTAPPPAQTVPAPVQTAPPSPPAPVVQQPAPNAVQLQLGLFRNRENADNLVSRLYSAGFTASIVTQKRSGVDYFVVTMYAAEDNQRRLQAAGFDSFPVR